jgi:predicted DNA-binding transcriptional regulator AlpA
MHDADLAYREPATSSSNPHALKAKRRSSHSRGIGDEQLLDVNEAGAMLGLSPKTLYQWAYERRVPVVKLFGRALRFRLSVIRKLIKDSERPALRALDCSDQPSA